MFSYAVPRACLGLSSGINTRVSAEVVRTDFVRRNCRNPLFENYCARERWSP